MLVLITPTYKGPVMMTIRLDGVSIVLIPWDLAASIPVSMVT